MVTSSWFLAIGNAGESGDVHGRLSSQFAPPPFDMSNAKKDRIILGPVEALAVRVWGRWWNGMIEPPKVLWFNHKCWFYWG